MENNDYTLDMLETFVVNLLKYYNNLYDEWSKVRTCRINFKRKKLYEVFMFDTISETKYSFFDNEFIGDIEKYLTFLNEQMIISPPFDYRFKELNISSRVKAFNSVLYKVIYYCAEKKERGHVPIKKCINDLLGYRVILNDEIEYDDIVKLLDKIIKDTKSDRISYIKANRANNDYNAIHVYFQYDNFSYRWELQIWLKRFEHKNIESHKLHKQEYTKWEFEIKKLKKD